MTIIVRCSALITCLLLLVACGTTDSTMRQAGHNEAYVQGFHDGRHSGMQEAGNTISGTGSVLTLTASTGLAGSPAKPRAKACSSG
jgi:hypothetical protein